MAMERLRLKRSSDPMWKARPGAVVPLISLTYSQILSYINVQMHNALCDLLFPHTITN